MITSLISPWDAVKSTLYLQACHEERGPHHEKVALCQIKGVALQEEEPPNEKAEGGHIAPISEGVDQICPLVGDKLYTIPAPAVLLIWPPIQ